MKKEAPFWIEFLSGWVAGVVQLIVAQPMDIIKVRLQTEKHSLTHHYKYSRTFGTFQNILKHEGLLAFYKGSLSPLIGIGTITAIQFAAFKEARKVLNRNFGMQDSMLCVALSGSFAGVASSFVVSPVEHTMIRLQTQSKGKIRLYSGSVDAAIKITKKYGFQKGLMNGWIATVVRDFPQFFVYFGTYELICRWMNGWDLDARNTQFQMTVAGAMTGLASWFSIFPLDSLKSISQTQNLDSPEYKNYRELVKGTLKTRGLRPLYGGFWVCMARSMPVNAITFIVYEDFRALMLH